MPSQIFTTGQAGDSRLFYQNPQGSYQQIANPTQLQDLAKQGLVQVGGQRAVMPQGSLPPTTPATPPSPTTAVPPTDTASPIKSNTANMEVSPGVYNSSELTNYYNTEIERNRESYNQAKNNLQNINTQITDLYNGPSLQSQYNTQLASATTGIDQQINQSIGRLRDVDVALAGIEQEVRGRIGQGQAPEAYIQAEIARQSTPLINERNALANNLNALQGQRQNIVQGVGQSLELAQADQARKLNLLNVQKALADQTVSTFNSLIEKGATATDRERDNARQLFSQFLQQTPEFLTHLSEDEINQLQRGVIPYSALTKLGKTIAQQKMEADRVKNTVSESDIRSLAGSLYANDPSYADYPAAYAEAKRILNTPTNTGDTGGNVSNSSGIGSGLTGQPVTNGQTTKQVIPSFESWAQQQEQSRGMSLDRNVLKPQYDAFVAAIGTGSTSTDTTSLINAVNQMASGSSAQVRTQMVRDVQNFIKNGDIAGAQNYIKTLAYKKLSAGQQGTFDEYDLSSQALDQALHTLDVADTSVGPYKKLAEDKKPWLLIQKDPNYTELFQWIRAGQSQVSRALFGTAITATEAKTAEQFLVGENDDLNTIKQKLSNLNSFMNYANEKELSRVTGQKMPSLNQYINSGGNLDYSGYIDSFSQDLSRSVNGSNDLGSLSAKYESGGDPGAIGYDNTGGYSYGTYQLAFDNAKKFIDQSPYSPMFKGLKQNSQAFMDKWKQVAKTDPNGFEQAQHEYIQQNYFEPQAKKLSAIGIDVNNLSPVIRDVIWSTAVQHGANNDIIVQAVKATKNKNDPQEFIRNVYALRWANGRNFARSTPEVKQAVYNRFFGKNGELARALALTVA